MILLLRSDNGWSALSPENRDPLFRIALKTLKFEGMAPKKEARPKGPGTPYSLQRNIVINRRKTMVYSTADERFVGAGSSQLEGFCGILHRSDSSGLRQ
jgi:hypothetical protein